MHSNILSHFVNSLSFTIIPYLGAGRTYGPEYIGCDEFRPSVSSQGIRSWNLLVSQAYDEITTREEIKALLPIYENLADRLTVRSRSVHLCPSLFSKCFSISCQCFHLHET
ncbi:unnamed protein product [Trichobilharzia szidati]|nr:unnamed protein product [Trichobilharzia szidati]